MMLLEQLTEIEKSIQEMEKLMDELGIQSDREKLIQIILAKKQVMLSGQNKFRKN